MSAVYGDNDSVPDLTNKELLKTLLDEIASVRKELKEDISTLDERLNDRIDGVSLQLNKFTSELKGLRFQLHQNHTSFITNQEELGKRVSALEAA
ncbi:hypothetical protein HYW84_00635 [Candidatus Peregrinibacteria bacterium]|nr:hypothetical protein [Candidatus Peregrinibacteria bacterium]